MIVGVEEAKEVWCCEWRQTLKVMIWVDGGMNLGVETVNVWGRRRSWYDFKSVKGKTGTFFFN